MGEWGEEREARDKLRTTFVQIAIACVRATGKQYLDLVGPCESDQMRSDMLRMWGCALLVRALFRLLGVDHPRLHAPYKVAAAPADIWAVARSAKWPKHKVQSAFIYPFQDPVKDAAILLNKGHVLCIGQGAITHYLIVVGVTTAGTVLSVDGGQNGGPGIALVERRVVVKNQQIYLKDERFTRRVRFAVDPGLLLPLIPKDMQWMLPRWEYSSAGVKE